MDKIRKVAILTAKDDWFVPYAQILKKSISNSELFYDHKIMNNSFDVVFILSYYRMIDESILKHNKHNIVIHGSALPKGKGWAPVFWQILEGKNEIPFTMFEASKGMDDGDIYIQKTLILNGFELNNEIREKQAKFIVEMCLDFLNNYNNYNNYSKRLQIGEESFYKQRTINDSELDIDKTIKEQFNLLRIVDNKKYPAFFYLNDKKYKIMIEEDFNDKK